eukprot:11045952-Prorocentrum_lima.AAC.1
MRNHFRRSKLELSRPRHGIKVSLRGSQGLCSAPLFALRPMAATRSASGRACGASWDVWEGGAPRK